jgi:hypothetical protein
MFVLVLQQFLLENLPVPDPSSSTTAGSSLRRDRLREVICTDRDGTQRRNDDELDSTRKMLDVAQQLAHDEKIQRMQRKGHGAARRVCPIALPRSRV